jgi:hypothetical protein
MLSSFVQSHVENERKIITLLSDLWRHLPFAPTMDNGQLIVLGDPYLYSKCHVRFRNINSIDKDIEF